MKGGLVPVGATRVRGYVFRALMGYAEERFGSLAVERMLEKADLPSQGAYTAVGHYPVEELIALADALCAVSEVARKEILIASGRRAMPYVIEMQAQNSKAPTSLETILASLQDLIHTNLEKLYPGSISPIFAFDVAEDGWAEISYRSQCPLADLAEGLILGILDYMATTTDVVREDLAPFDGHAARFRVKLPAS
ncbi:MAG: heme NO-binding domain-containing protein [Kiloniellales bacterium]